MTLLDGIAMFGDALYRQKWSLVAAVLAIYLARKFVVYYRLRHLKGPWGSGFTNFYHTRNILGLQVPKWYRDMNHKYGPIARIGPHSLVTSDPDVWQHVNLKAGYTRAGWYYTGARIEYNRDNVFTETDNKEHDRIRKMIAPGFSGRENLELESQIDARLTELITLVRSKYLSTESRIVPMDLASKMQYLTLDVISTVGLGKPFGMLASDADEHGFLQSTAAGLLINNTFMGLGLSWLAQTRLGHLLAPKSTDATGFGKMIGLTFQFINERAANPTNVRSDMLASFIRHGLADDELRSEGLEQVVAGSDTTAAALRGTMLYLMTHKRVYAKLQAEIDANPSPPPPPPPPPPGVAEQSSSSIISIAKAKQLPYLQAVIREAMRVWPPVANLFPRATPPVGDTVMVDGQPIYLPGGVDIGYCALGIHHSKRVYGDDADAFRPERWLVEKDPDRLANMIRVNDLSFGHGRWGCLGKTVAQIELGKTIFELLRNFDWALIDPTNPWSASNVYGLFLISDMWVEVTARR
ncbi:cytochrome P450 [Lasiosphaeria ovina]|uniref:Cytochrome P450 n=1 Tax=Lasiosphaeria ovina TaxID=92902 RepID=A0AAE0K3M8_9PEZI|nr:cytochrome P450 [Lasiosphaeria ovina]